MGFGAGLTSGQAMASSRLQHLCGLAADEAAVCCVNIGTVAQRKRAATLRPVPADFVTQLAPAAAGSQG
jgi:hypothetical protein